ncbi:translocation/assembly module TamB domain-containing protein [Thiomonas sp.]|uniref:translocation/assembly module TamB domain-containing protein n=1 Tax=Thiomonas sp. TaxID=2047785 RepID=UPI002627CF7B|nr:translocation/assembly module TamB domain-containing protein [Thiomonas sp.]
MAQQPPAQRPAVTTRRRWRLLVWLLALPPASLLTVAAALAWLGSNAGLQWLAARTPLHVAGAQLSVQEVSGSLWHALRIGRLQIVTAGQRITLRDVQLRWQPAALWQRTLRVQTLQARALDIAFLPVAAPTAPRQLPASLRLPLRLAIDHLGVDALRLGNAGALQPVGSVSGALHSTATGYALQLQAQTPWARGVLRLTLGDAAPYAVHAALHLTQIGSPASPTAPGVADVLFSGSLHALQLHGSAQVRAAHAQWQAEVMPFAATPLRRAWLSARGVDPAAFDPALPHAALDADLTLGPSDAQQVHGRLSVRNASPGPLDRHRLPLHRLQLALAGNAQRADARDVHIDLGAGGTLRGSLDWAQQTLHARLQASQVDARALDSTLVATRLSGPLTLTATAQEQTVQLALTQPGWEVRLAAQRRGSVVRVTQLRLSAPGGELDASGTVGTAGAQDFAVQARLRRFDPSRFGAYPAARLNATLSAQGSVQRRSARLALQLDPSAWRGQTFTGRARLALDAQRLWDVDAALTLGANRLDASGAFGRSGDTLQWSLHAPALAQLDPALHGTIQAQGVVRGGWHAPAGRVRLDAGALRWGSVLTLASLHADGTFDTARAAASGGASLPALLQRLTASLQLDLSSLQWAQGSQPLRIGALHASAQTGAGAAGAIALNARLHDAQTAEVALRSASLQVDGTRQQHTVALTAQGQMVRGGAAAAIGDIDLALRAAGGWSGAAPGWRGQITALDNAGPLAVRLQAPAALDLAFAPLRLQLRHAVLQLQSGVVDLANLDIARGQWHTQGRLRAVRPAAVLALAGLAPQAVRDSLLLSGDWQLDAGTQLNGRIHLQRDGGDVALRLASAAAADGRVRLAPTCDAVFGATPARNGELPLGLGQMVLDLSIRDDHVRAQAVVQTAMGTAQGSAQTVLSRRGTAWGIAGSAPLQLDAGADMPSLAWAAPLLGPDYRAEGRLRLAVQARGSVAQPQFSGSLTGSALRLAWPAQGLDLRDGTLRAQFTGDRLQLDSLLLHGGAGRLSASGDARLQAGALRAAVQLDAEHLQVLDRPDRQLVLSGRAQARLAEGVLALTSDLTADRADIALPRTGGPALSSDVVVAGRTAPAAARPAVAMPQAVRFDGTFHLGPRFHLYGQGLDAMLGGSVRVRAGGDTPPTASGSIDVVKGEYTAYGQQLQVTQGRINFAGPLDNPGLNITATRPNLPRGIDVGVAIGGRAQRPQVKLTSTPAMPDTQILSWLVLGQPIDQVGAADIGLLQTAAATLLGPADGLPLQTRLAHALGLDSISVQTAAGGTTTNGGATGGVGSTIVTLSKRLSADTLVSFSRGLDGVSSIFTIQRQLGRRLSVQAKTGTENAIDLFYTFEFD